MKKIVLVAVVLICFTYTAKAQSEDPREVAKDIIQTLRDKDTKNNSCYTTDGKEGRFRPNERTTTSTTSRSNGSSYNSGSTSTTGGTGASVGTNTSATVNSSRTYNSGSSSRNNSSSNGQSTVTKEVCVDKDKLPLYK